jgi:hypothetical protein
LYDVSDHKFAKIFSFPAWKNRPPDAENRSGVQMRRNYNPGFAGKYVTNRQNSDNMKLVDGYRRKSQRENRQPTIQEC